MNLTIDNLGKVGHAGIRLDGITVIAGENGSGKSTISKTLMAISKSSLSMADWLDNERIRSIHSETLRILSEGGVPVRPWLLAQDGEGIDLLEPSFWDNHEAVDSWIRNAFRSYSDDDDSRLTIAKMNSLTNLIADAAKQAISTPEKDYEDFLLNRFFNQTFSQQLGTLADENAVSTMLLETDDGTPKQFLFKNGKLISSQNSQLGAVPVAYYLAPFHILDNIPRLANISFSRRRLETNRMAPGNYSDWREMLFENPPDDTPSLEASKRQSAVNKELDQIVSTIHGELQKEDRELKFFDLDFNSFIPVGNMASGAKTIAMLIRGLRNGRIAPDGLVIIDEPETNLHPEWQVRFAEFLVLLHARFSLRMLLNTHSPYFLKAIQTYSDRLDVRDACQYYKMERQGDAVLYSSRDVTGDIEFVFADLSRPYARLLYGDSYDGNPPR